MVYGLNLHATQLVHCYEWVLVKYRQTAQMSFHSNEKSAFHHHVFTTL